MYCLVRSYVDLSDLYDDFLLIHVSYFKDLTSRHYYMTSGGRTTPPYICYGDVRIKFFNMFLFVKVFSDFWLYICLFHDQLENSTKVSKWKIDEIHPCIWWCFSVGVSRGLTWPITNPLCTKLFYKRIWVQWNWLFTEFNERNTSIQRSIKFNIMSKTWKYERLSILFKSN